MSTGSAGSAAGRPAVRQPSVSSLQLAAAAASLTHSFESDCSVEVRPCVRPCTKEGESISGRD